MARWQNKSKPFAAHKRRRTKSMWNNNNNNNNGEKVDFSEFPKCAPDLQHTATCQVILLIFSAVCCRLIHLFLLCVVDIYTIFFFFCCCSMPLLSSFSISLLCKMLFTLDFRCEVNANGIYAYILHTFTPLHAVIGESERVSVWFTSHKIYVWMDFVVVNTHRIFG